MKEILGQETESKKYSNLKRRKISCYKKRDTMFTNIQKKEIKNKSEEGEILLSKSYRLLNY